VIHCLPAVWKLRAAGFLFKAMSLLSDFTIAAHLVSAPVIGMETITIGGSAAISGILNEANFHRDYEEGGFDQSATLDFVASMAAFTAACPNAAKSYEGNKATARGESWRVGAISTGASFVKISLISSNKSA